MKHFLFQIYRSCEVITTRFCVQWHTAQVREAKQHCQNVPFQCHFCFSYSARWWQRIHKYTRNTLVWSISFKQKNFHEKTVLVAKVRIFLLRQDSGSLVWLGTQWRSMDPNCKNPISMKNNDFSKKLFLLDRHTFRESLKRHLELWNVLHTWYEKQKWKYQIFVYKHHTHRDWFRQHDERF